MRQLAVAAGVIALTALSWFEFPGHTWLRQDTQIYVPILEHLRDPAVLGKDLLAARPHVSYTLYDESARALAAMTGLSFRAVLEGEQFVTRALGIWGLYLMAAALGFPAPASLLIAGIISLGATIAGPAVLSFEIEPDPRGFAIPLLLLAIGFASQGRDLAAGVAGSAAFLLHAPTVIPFWAVFAVLIWVRRRFRAFLPLAAGCLILGIFARLQQGGGETQVFLGRIPPALEAVQHLRVPYVWISAWGRDWLPHYLVVYAASLLAYARIRRRAPLELRYFLIGLPALGILSVPASYFLLEQMKWILIPQLQPMRALLFVTVVSQFAALAAGIMAVESRRYAEAFAWFVFTYLIPLNTNITWMPSWNRALAAGLLAAAACAALWWVGRRKTAAWVAALAVAMAGFFVVPSLGAVHGAPPLRSTALDELSRWARGATPQDAVFLFPDAGRGLQPGVFRAEALRAVYVDWKGGGQVNYLPELGMEWWHRWQQTMAAPFDPGRSGDWRARGIDYVVLSPQHRLPDRAPAFENTGYLVYAL